MSNDVMMAAASLTISFLIVDNELYC